MSPHPYHFAVVVGINSYPGGFKPLAGPVNDARAFADWLAADDQGGLPAAHVRLVTTPARPPVRVSTARPTKELIDDAIWESVQDLDRALDLLPEEERAAARAESRFYLFVAGHGIMPGQGEAALLDAKARMGFLSNLEIRSYVDWLRKDGSFAQVVAFADCCRSFELLAVPGQAPFGQAARIRGPVETLVGLAATAGSVSVEDTDPDIPMDARRGYFSRALVDGLRGNAADPDTGQVTSTRLRDYVVPLVADRSRTKSFQQTVEMPVDRDMVFGPVHVAPEPEPHAASTPGRQRRRVVIRFPSGFVGEVELVAPDGTLLAWDSADGDWIVRLYDGVWFVQRAGTRMDTGGLADDGVFTVEGVDRDVQL